MRSRALTVSPDLELELVQGYLKKKLTFHKNVKTITYIDNEITCLIYFNFDTSEAANYQRDIVSW